MDSPAAFVLAPPSLRPKPSHIATPSTPAPLRHRPVRTTPSRRRTCRPASKLELPARNDSVTPRPTSKSVAGGAALIAGCAIGAGMLALPVETASAGYGPSEVSLLLCWLFTNLSSLLVLEGSKVALTQLPKDADNQRPFSFLSMAESALGPTARWITASVYMLVMVALETAYVSGACAIVASPSLPGNLTPAEGSMAFAAVFGLLVATGPRWCDLVNRGLVAGLVGSFLVMISRGVGSVDLGHLLSASNWGAIFPGGLSIAMVAFLSQGTIPTVLQYFGGNVRKTRQAIVVGNMVPLLVYSIWEAVALNAVPYTPGMSKSPGEFLATLGAAIGGDGGQFYSASIVFSLCALTSSFLGVGLGLIDCLEDLLGQFGESSSARGAGSRIAAASAGVGVPLAFALVFHDAFAVTLENVGLIAALLLFGVLPSLVVLQTRRVSEGLGPRQMFSRRLAQTPGGTPTVAGMIATSMSLIVPEAGRLFVS